jgi:hypothetical protein
MTWKIIRDYTGYYRSMPDIYKPQEGEESVEEGLSYLEATEYAARLIEIELTMKY